MCDLRASRPSVCVRGVELASELDVAAGAIPDANSDSIRSHRHVDRLFRSLVRDFLPVLFSAAAAQVRCSELAPRALCLLLSDTILRRRYFLDKIAGAIVFFSFNFCAGYGFGWLLQNWPAFLPSLHFIALDVIIIVGRLFLPTCLVLMWLFLGALAKNKHDRNLQDSVIGAGVVCVLGLVCELTVTFGSVHCLTFASLSP